VGSTPHGSADYFATLAVIAVTFVGFSTIFVSMRQAMGGEMSKYDVLLTRNILNLGLLVVAGSLIPALLVMFRLGPEPAARIGSALVAIPAVVFNLTYPRRRRAATGHPMPRKVVIDLALVYLAAVVLAAGALGTGLADSVALHALGLTILLGATFLAFLFGLALLPKEQSRPLDEGQGETTGRDSGLRSAAS
jgi:hypothetical protein